jgi:hypothetical protein
MFHRRKIAAIKDRSRAVPDATARERMNGTASQNYFCQVRFLWRFKRSFLRRLCLLILALRRFLIEPINYF